MVLRGGGGGQCVQWASYARRPDRERKKVIPAEDANAFEFLGGVGANVLWVLKYAHHTVF